MNRPVRGGALGARVRSFGYAGRGIVLAARGGNLRLQLFAGVVVVALLVAYAVTGVELAVVAVCVALVLAAEIVNTAIERLCDLVDELHGLGRDPRIGAIKDLAAGGVLVTALGAAGAGVVVFGPLLVDTLR